jgi:hypothetical protein
MAGSSQVKPGHDELPGNLRGYNTASAQIKPVFRRKFTTTGDSFKNPSIARDMMFATFTSG